MKKNISVRATVQCALFLAIGLLLRNFSYMVSMGGGTGMRIGFSGVFVKLPALIFGPVLGGITCGLYDALGAIIKPEGAYIFPLTVTAALGGVMYGFVYAFLKNKDARRIKSGYLAAVFLFGLLGTGNFLFSSYYPSSFIGTYLLSLGKKLPFFTFGLWGVCFVGILFFVINTILEKKTKKDFMENYLKIFITLLLCDIPITTANTFILIKYIPALGKLGFLPFYLPRLTEEIFLIFITAYLMSYFIDIYKKI